MLTPFALVLVANAAIATDTVERIDWNHPTLVLYVSSVSDAGAHNARLELCVTTQPGMAEGSTSVGFPRYRTVWGRWVDSVTQGVGSDRALHARSGAAPDCISMLVARDATALRLPIGGQVLQLDLASWLTQGGTRPAPAVEVEDPWTEQAPLEPRATPGRLRVATPSAAPDVQLTGDWIVEGVASPIPRETIMNVRLYARNVGRGPARDVAAWIEPGRGVLTARDGAERIDLGELGPGETAEFVYRCYADRSATALSFQVTLDHRAAVAGGKASVVSLPLAEKVPEIVPQASISDVDRSVPHSTHARPTGLAVVLGVEAYDDAPLATHAAADARTAARYFEQALGIPPERIELLLDRDVTLGQFQRLFGEGGWLARRARPDSEIFVFFAGHGMAEHEEFSPYLLPSDADPNYIRQTAVSVDRVIELVSALDARSATLFFDACFSGLSREGASLLADARPLVIVPVQSTAARVSVFSAGAGNQIASSLEGQGHGLFSYHLFRGLGGAADLDADHVINAGELKHYLEDAVPRAAETLDREQHPAITLDDPAQLLVRLP